MDDKTIAILMRNYPDLFPDDLNLEEFTDIGKKRKKSNKKKKRKSKKQRKV